ncbi:MAG: IS6 family transposase [Chloroflexi bacterium]|nr:IS6 family transposase [Chloroflexota bacterium]
MTSDLKAALREALEGLGLPFRAQMQQVDFTETVSITIVCKFCGSDAVIRYGTKEGVQQYWCYRCKRKFSATPALPGMRYPPGQIAAALNAFYEGQSLRAVQRQLDTTYGVMPSDSTVYYWVKRFTEKAIDVAQELRVHAGSVWMADETVLNMDGKNVWFWDCIDDKTRFLLASRLSITRGTQDAKALMEQALRVAGHSPEIILTDKLAAYLDGIELVFGADVEHIRSKGFKIHPNTNLIERFHGTIKQRTKVMRGMQNIETAKIIMGGWLVHYNFFRPHEGLDGKTPGEVAQAGFPYKGWNDVVSEGYIPTERREVRRGQV